MTTRNVRLRFTTLNFFADSFAIFLSLLAAFYIRFHSPLPLPVSGTIPSLFDYTKTLILILPIYILCFRAYKLYNSSRSIRRIEEIFLVVKAISISILLLMAISFFYREMSYSRITLVFIWIISMIFVSVSRYLVIQFEYHYKRNSKDTLKLLLIGAGRKTRNIIRWAETHPHYGVSIMGVIVNNHALVGKTFAGKPIIGQVDQTEDIIKQQKPHQVALLNHQFSRHRITDLVILCEDLMIDFKIGADFYGLMSRNVDVEYISTVPLLGFKSLPLDDLWNRLLKRGFDIASSFLLLFFTSPIWLTVIVLIKLDSSGPILYRQKRMGRDQQIFNVLKFRTMKVNAEAETGPVWANENDTRKTKIGAFLRRWNLDELPQLFNVLRGQMSMVGPRPERPHFIEEFRGSIPRYMSRHRIKSGITGWAAVNGYRGNTSIVERTKYDLYYMENWSLLFDIEIILMTAFAFKNAY